LNETMKTAKSNNIYLYAYNYMKEKYGWRFISNKGKRDIWNS
jgi:hypothetical protein